VSNVLFVWFFAEFSTVLAQLRVVLFRLFDSALFQFSPTAGRRMMTNDQWRNDHFTHYNGQHGHLSYAVNEAPRSSQDGSSFLSFPSQLGIPPSAVCDTTLFTPSVMVNQVNVPQHLHSHAHVPNHAPNGHRQIFPQTSVSSPKDHNFHVQQEKLRQMSLPRRSLVRVLKH
jgi:hypothetical protein